MATTLYIDMPAEIRARGLKLGLGDLQLRPHCSGYDHLCVCDDCLTRDERMAQLGKLRSDRREIALLRDDHALLELNTEAKAA
jgi:hypothetical protein